MKTIKMLLATGFVLVVSLLTVLAQADTNIAVVTGTVESDVLAPLLKLLGGESGWLAGVIAWIGTLRVPLKFINTEIQSALTKALLHVAQSPEKDDDTLLTMLLASRPYRGMAFGLDLLFSIKLPSEHTFRSMIE